MQVKKTKELEPLPSFSIGLTQMEEEGRNVTDGGKNKKQKTKEAKGKEKKKQEEAKSKEKNEGSSDEENAKQRLRHKMSIPKVYDLMNSVNGKQRKEEIINVLNESGFGGMVHICN